MSTKNSLSAEKCAFTREEAVKLIISLVENKVIGLPFTQCFNAERVANNAERYVRQSAHIGTKVTEALLREADTYAIGNELENLARKDGIFLLALLQTLTEGLTENERSQIAHWRSRQ